MKGDLGRLPRAAEEEEERDAGGEHAAVRERSIRRLQDGNEIQRPEGREDQEHGDEEARVADPVHDERLLARVRVVPVLVPEADEQVRAEPHALPAHEHEREAGPEDEYEHEEDEEVEVREVAGIAGIVAHVADGIDVDQAPDTGHDHAHQHRELVELEVDPDAEVPGHDPVPQADHFRAMQFRAAHRDEVDEDDREAPEQRRGSDDRRDPLVVAPQEGPGAVHRRPKQREGEDEPREHRMEPGSRALLPREGARSGRKRARTRYGVETHHFRSRKRSRSTTS